MEITAKDRIWQCWFCSSYYPAQLTPVLALHLQWHIERCPSQEPGHHVCPGRTKEPKDGNRKACREKHETPEELAHHILDTHTKKRWCSTENRRYRKAMNESLEEKDQLIKKLSADGTTPDRALATLGEPFPPSWLSDWSIQVLSVRSSEWLEPVPELLLSQSQLSPALTLPHTLGSTPLLTVSWVTNSPWDLSPTPRVTLS